MSEACQVLLTTEYLNNKLQNSVITNLENINGNIRNKTVYNKLKKGFPYIVESVKCKGKLIYFTLFNEKGYIYILHNLKFYGEWKEYNDDFSRFYIENEFLEKLWFSNIRSYYNIEFTDDEKYLLDELNELGIDILSKEFTYRKWKELIKNNEMKNVTVFLMDQSIISGVCNNLKSEVLYYAKISPFRTIINLNESEMSKLYEAIKIIPRVIYNKKIMLQSDKEKYIEEYKIYGIITSRRSKTLDGNITYWDPDIQK